MQHWFLNVHNLADSSRAAFIWWLSTGCPADSIISTSSLASIVSWWQCSVRPAPVQMAQAGVDGRWAKFRVSPWELPIPVGTEQCSSPGIKSNVDLEKPFCWVPLTYTMNLGWERPEDTTQNCVWTGNPIMKIFVNVQEEPPPYKLLIHELFDLETQGWHSKPDNIPSKHPIILR